MTALEQFEQAVCEAYDDRPATRNEWWRHRLVYDKGKARCCYCGRAIQRGKAGTQGRGCMDHLVPVFHGGPQRTENLVPACWSCNLQKRSTDLLLWEPPYIEPAALAALNERRLEMLAWSENHLLRNPNLGKKKATVVRHLSDRWQHPRFMVWASLTEEAGFISLTGPNKLPADLLPMLLQLGARQVRYQIFQLPPTRFHDALWTLIDHNALVRRVDLPDFPDPTPDAPGNAQWSVTFSSVLDVRRRRPKLKPVWVPPIERPMDWGRRLLLEYEASGKDRRPFDWDWVNKHKETDREWMRKQREIAVRQERELKEALARMPPSLSVPAFFQELDRRLANPGPEDTLTRLAREHGIKINGDTAGR